MQHFGSRDELVAAVMSIRPEALARFRTAFEGPDEPLGERVGRAYLDGVGSRDLHDDAAVRAGPRSAEHP